MILLIKSIWQCKENRSGRKFVKPFQKSKRPRKGDERKKAREPRLEGEWKRRLSLLHQQFFPAAHPLPAEEKENQAQKEEEGLHELRQAEGAVIDKGDDQDDEIGNRYEASVDQRGIGKRVA